MYPFGYGLSYTRFALCGEKAEIADGEVRASVTVTNVGDYPGREVVQAYVRRLFTGRSEPVRELRGFKSIDLQPGEQRRVEVRLELPRGCYDVVLAPDSASGAPVRWYVQ